MPAIFLPGPFAEYEMLRAILGSRGRTPKLRPAVAEGYALTAAPNAARVALAVTAGGATAGALAEAGEEAAARLEYALAAFGAGARAETVRIGEDEALLVVSRSPVGPDYPAAPDPEWRAHLVEAAAEAMAHFGGRAAAETEGLMLGVSYRALARVRGAAAAGGRARRRYGPERAEVTPLGLAIPYARYFAIEEHRLRHRRFDGGETPAIERAVFASGDAATLVPFDPRRGAVLLIEQFRIGPHARRDPHPWRLEAVAGRCDAGEDAEATARREAREEAGVAVGRIERMFSYYTSPGVMSEYITAFVGEADLAGAGGLHGLADEAEDIRVHVLPLAEAMRLVRSGDIDNAPLLVSLLWLEREADRLAAAWAGGAG